MTFKELIDLVSDVIQDPSFTDTYIGSVINRGIQTVSAGVLLPGKYDISPPLPDLYTTDDVDTVLDSGVVDLPADFGRSLVLVVNEGGDHIPVAYSFRKFLAENRELEAGYVRLCAVNGKRLLYRDVPETAETLTLHYYAKPDLMEDEDEEPDYIPEGLQYHLLVGFAAKEIFNLIEDGISGPKVNTKAWTDLYHQAVYELGVFIGEDGESFNIARRGMAI